jgi:hypothetical protein
MYHILCIVNHFLGKIPKYFAFLPPEAEKRGFCVIFPEQIAVFGIGLSGPIIGKSPKRLQPWGLSC